MKICSPSMGISPNSDLGGEVYERELLSRLPKYGAKIGLILPKESEIPETLDYHYIYRLPLKRRLRWFISNPLFLQSLNKAYSEKGIELLRIHSFRFTGPAILLSRKTNKIDAPVIAHHHHIDPENLNWFVDKRVAKLVDKIITVSEFSKKQLHDEWGIPENRIDVIYDGVSETFLPEEKDKVLKEKYAVEGKKVLLYLGALKKRKNLFFLLECLKGLSEISKDIDWVCLISGRGEDSQALIRKSKSLGISDRVKFCGYIPESKKLSMLNLCDVFLFPSVLEGFGMAAVEAMACGKPVVALNNASLPEIVKNGETGFLVSPGNRKEYISSLFSLVKDDKMRREMGLEASSCVKRKFNWDRCAEKVMNSYKKLVDSYKRERKFN